MSNIMEILKKPVVMGVLLLIVGVIFGLTLGWGVWPATFKDAPIGLLRDDLKKEYLKMAFDSARVSGDTNLLVDNYQKLDVQKSSTGMSAAQILDTIRPEIDPTLLQEFDKTLAARTATEQPGGGEPGDGGMGTLITVGIIVISLVLIGGVVFFFVLPLFRSNRRAPEDMTPAMQAAELSRSIEKTDYSAVASEPPVAQYVTTYLLGDDLFDDSFSIDAPSGEFLGECGIGISEVVGVGDPKKVTAFEVWMFDKNDIQTVTKVLMSANAFRDPSLRAKLEPKGELVQLEPRKQIVLETQTLQMIATISDMQYGQSTLPTGSYFDRLTMELAIWSKK